MTLQELREEAWAHAREVAINDQDRLWPTAEMNAYINRVYRFIARETKCIRDSITPTICRIISAPPADIGTLTTQALTDSYAAQDLAWYNSSGSWLYQKLVAPYAYSLSPLVLDVDEVKWENRQWKLQCVSVVKWRTNPWWEQVLGMPTEYALDGDNNMLFVNFRGDTADTLKLAVRRLPLANLVQDTDQPEFRVHYHDFMLNGILMYMYRKQDSQTFDEVKAIDYEAKFKLDIDEIKQQEVILNQKLNPNNSLDAFR